MRSVQTVCLTLALLASAVWPVQGRTVDDALALLRAAAEATGELATLHFTVRNEEGETEIAPGVTVEEIEGDVVRPDRFRAVIRAKALFATVEIEIVGVGERFWWTNPIAGQDGFEESNVDPDLLALANPDTLVRLIPELIVAPAVAGRETLDGARTTRVAGTLDLGRLEDVAPEIPTGDVETEQPLPIEVWIDEDGRITQVRLAGPFVEQDGDDVVRLIELSAFDEPVEILPPSAGSGAAAAILYRSSMAVLADQCGACRAEIVRGKPR